MIDKITYEMYTYYCQAVAQIAKLGYQRVPGPTRKGGAMDLYRMPGHLIRRMNQRSAQVFHKRALEAGFDMTSVQFAALDALHHHPGIDQAQLSALIAYDRATIGGVVDRLEGKGLVQRQVSSRDRRAREVRLTAQGAAVFARMLPLVEALQVEILEHLDDAERAQLMALMRKALDWSAPGGA